MKSPGRPPRKIALAALCMVAACTQRAQDIHGEGGIGGSFGGSNVSTGGLGPGQGGAGGQAGITSLGGVTGHGGAGPAGGSATGGNSAFGGMPWMGGRAAGGMTTTGLGGMGSSSRGGAGGAGASGGNAGNSGRPREDGGNLPDIERDAGPFLVGGSNAGGGGTSGGSAGRGGGSGAGGAGKWQIMALGDSVTGTTCYPKLLSKVLIDRGHDNFELVGTVLNNQSCGNDVANVQTEGHGGYLVTYLTSDNDKSQDKGSLTELLSWAAEKPQVVLMEYGTNDCWTSSIPLSDITSAFGFVVDRFRAERPDVIFFVAQITPLNPSGCSTCETRVEGLNALIPTWADSKSTAASPVYVVDVWSSLPAASYKPNSTYTSDGAHPNVAGSQLMADVWADALIARGIP